MSSEARETKPKINYWDCIKIKSSAQQRKQFTKLKDNLLEWEKIFANDISNKGLVSKMELQIKTKMRYHLTPVRMVKIKNKKQVLARMWRKRKLPYDQVIPLPGIYTNNTKTLIQNDICTPMFTVALFIIAKLWKQPKYPLIDEWIKKRWYMYTMEYYSAKKGMKSYHLQQHGSIRR
ncbi:Hypothetical predicted protein, partial [Lynx pardinus]